MKLYAASFQFRIRFVALIMTMAIVVVSCGGGSGNAPPVPPPPVNPGPDFVWTNVSPDGGYVSSIAFHPTAAGEVWASGDDASGIYRSTNSGSTWTFFENMPPDQSTYSLTFDAADPNRVYALNNIGSRGMLKTSNGGQTWQVTGAGLPTTDFVAFLPDTAIDPGDPSTLFVATVEGLYRSTDFGDTFSLITSPTFGTESSFQTVTVDASGNVYVGADGGSVFASNDAASTWSVILPASSLSVTDLAVTPNALYIAMASGDLYKTTTFDAAGLTLINEAFGTGALESFLWTKLAVVAGATAATDTLYIGTVFTQGSAKWGFFISTDGGATYAKKVTGLDDNSIFSVAVDPFDSNHVLCGTIGGGIYSTNDGGDLWTPSSSGIKATAVLGFAEDIADPNHLLISSTANLDNVPGVFETFNGGNSWSQVTTISSAITSLDIDPSDANIILAGTGPQNPGILRSTSGSAGPWTPVLPATVQIERFIRDTANSQNVYALATDFAAPASVADLRIYFSSDGGATWVQQPFFATHVATHPANTGEALSVFDDAYATTDFFGTTLVSLGLSAFAPGENFTAVAFDPSNPVTILVGSTTGKLYLSSNYSSSGAGVTWSQVTNPAIDMVLRSIVITPGGTWYVSGLNIWPQQGAAQGLMRSTDRGANWQFLTEDVMPSQMAWEIRPSPADPNRFYVPLWGGGLLKLQE